MGAGRGVGRPRRLGPVRLPVLAAGAGLLAVATACATGNAGDREPVHTTDQYLVQYRMDLNGHRTDLEMPLERVEALMPEAFELLGLPVGKVKNVRATTFSTPRLQITGRLYEGERNSDYVNCGGGLGAGTADTHELELMVVTRLRASESGGTIMETILDGRARDRFTGADDALPCQGTGKLERQLVATVRELNRVRDP